jgi:hypothetical protein
VGDFSLRGGNSGESGDSSGDRGGGDSDTLAVTLDVYGFRAV